MLVALAALEEPVESDMLVVVLVTVEKVVRLLGDEVVVIRLVVELFAIEVVEELLLVVVIVVEL